MDQKIFISDYQLRAMRDSPMTLQQIGDVLGVSKERVRQRLTRQFGATKVAYLSKRRLVKQLGCSYSYLRYLEKREVLKPMRMGRTYLYNAEEAERARLAIQSYCVHCGKPKSLRKRSYCEECAREHARYSYPFLSKEQKKRVVESQTKWRSNNPEKVAEINNRARTKQKREHFATTQYVVVSKCALPIGTTFNAVGGKRGSLVLGDGMRVPVVSVRIKSAGRYIWQ